MACFMSTRSTRTIDNLDIQSYIHYEDNRKYFDEESANNARSIASQLSTDIFEPILITNYQLLFELGTKGTTWGLMPPPLKYNDQKGRLFTHQLAPKLGPCELIELQMHRIEEKRKTEKDKHDEQKKRQGTSSWEEEEEIKLIEKQAAALIDMMQNIQVLNKIMEQITAERYRYTKG